VSPTHTTTEKYAVYQDLKNKNIAEAQSKIGELQNMSHFVNLSRYNHGCRKDFFQVGATGGFFQNMSRGPNW